MLTCDLFVVANLLVLFCQAKQVRVVFYVKPVSAARDVRPVVRGFTCPRVHLSEVPVVV